MLFLKFFLFIIFIGLIPNNAFAKCTEADMQQMVKKGLSLTNVMEHCNKGSHSIKFLHGIWDVDFGSFGVDKWKFDVDGNSFLLTKPNEQPVKITQYQLSPQYLKFSYPRRERRKGSEETLTYSLNILSPTEMKGEQLRIVHDSSYLRTDKFLCIEMCKGGIGSCEDCETKPETFATKLIFLKN